MAARTTLHGLALGLLATCVGCHPLRQTSRSKDTLSNAAYTIPTAVPRTSEFAELQQFADREADKKERQANPTRSRSQGIKLTAAAEADRAVDGETRNEPLLPLLAEDDQPAPVKPPMSEAPAANPIFESAERLPPPKPVPTPPAKSANGPRELPTVEGQRLRLAPGESAVERAVLLSQMLEAAQLENRTLRERIRSLEMQIQEADRVRDDERQVAAQAAADATRYRLRMEALNEEVAALRERLRRAERQDVETLREIIAVLERLLYEEPSKRPAIH